MACDSRSAINVTEREWVEDYFYVTTLDFFQYALNFICNCSGLFHLSKACDSYQKPLQHSCFFFRVQLLNRFRGPIQPFTCPLLRNTFSGKRVAFSMGRKKETFLFCLKAKVWAPQEKTETTICFSNPNGN